MPRTLMICLASALAVAYANAAVPHGNSSVRENQKLNNLAESLLDVDPATTQGSFPFVRPSEGWIFVSLTTHGDGTIRLTLDEGSPGETPINPAPGNGPTYEAMQHVTKGHHTLQIEPTGTIVIDRLTVKAIPELMHCGLGFNPQIKSYGLYDLEFLKPDELVDLPFGGRRNGPIRRQTLPPLRPRGPDQPANQ